MITLYSLPSCGICHMVKTKLQQKQIQFEEKNFAEIAEIIHSDHAPALEAEGIFYNSPTEIVAWINKQ